MRKWEFKVRYDGGSCKIVVISDSGFNITRKVIEISHLYNDEDLSHVFSGNLLMYYS